MIWQTSPYSVCTAASNVCRLASSPQWAHGSLRHHPSRFCSTFCSQELRLGLNSPSARTLSSSNGASGALWEGRALCRYWRGIVLRLVLGLGAGDGGEMCVGMKERIVEGRSWKKWWKDGKWDFRRQVWKIIPTALVSIVLAAITDKPTNFSCLIQEKFSSCSQEAQTSVSDWQAVIFPNWFRNPDSLHFFVLTIFNVWLLSYSAWSQRRGQEPRGSSMKWSRFRSAKHLFISRYIGYNSVIWWHAWRQGSLENVV